MRLKPLCCCLIGLAAGAGCAPTSHPAPTQPAPVAQVGKGGRIVSIRTVSLHDSQDLWRANLLTEGGPAKPAAPNSTVLTEFIVRSDDGAIISIVQPNTPGFRPGDRVTIVQGETTRLTPPS